jgi:hypothetical protein
MYIFDVAGTGKVPRLAACISSHLKRAVSSTASGSAWASELWTLDGPLHYSGLTTGAEEQFAVRLKIYGEIMKSTGTRRNALLCCRLSEALESTRPPGGGVDG